MKELWSVIAVACVVAIAVVSPAEKRAAADDAGMGDAGAKDAAPPGPSGCLACVQCVAGCTTAYAECTRKCLGLPDFKSQQTCLTQCPTVLACAQACPCAGCADVPGLTH